MSAHRHINSFNAGELSPLMDARGDSDKYAFSCRKLENFVPRIYGGAFRRPGMEYLGTVGDDAAKVRLLPFNYSATTRFILELGDSYIRFWSNGVQVQSGGNAVEESTPYGEDDLFDVQFVQLNDVCYFTHPDYPPQKLTRVLDTTWTWEEMPVTWPCLGDANTTELTAAVAATTGTTTLTIENPLGTGVGLATVTAPFLFSNGLTMEQNAIDRYVQLVHHRELAYAEIGLTVSNASSVIRVLGNYDVFTYGTWGGDIKLQRQRPSGEWETLRTWFGVSNRNIVYSGTQLEEASLRLNFDHDSHTGSPRAVLEAADSRIYGLVRITGIDSQPSGSELVWEVEVIKEVHSTGPTEDFTVDAWNRGQGYPRAVAFHEQRLMFGGNVAQPNTVWGSVISDFENFQRLGYDDSGLAFTLAATEGSAIQGMVSHSTALNIFTQSEEWLIQSPSSDQAISPSNVLARRQSRFGSEYKQPFVANESILFLQRGARKIREWVYNAIEERSRAADLTLLAEHVTKGGIVQMAFQQQPDPVIWAVTGNGVLLSMTFERDQNVVGWSRHPTQGTAESVAVIYGDPGEADEVWLVVRRNIGGTDTRYVERIDPEAWIKLDNPGTYRDELIYLDAAVSQVHAEPTSTLMGLAHLEGETVTVLGDGQVHEGLTVSGGVLTLPLPVNTAIVGLPYTSLLQPAKTDLPLPDGSSRGRTWLMRRATLNLWETLGIEYADDDQSGSADWFPVPARQVETPLGEAEPLFTGEVDVLSQGRHRNNVDFTVRQRKPLPANVLSLVAKFEVHGS